MPKILPRHAILPLLLLAVTAWHAAAQQGTDHAFIFYNTHYTKGWTALPETGPEAEKLAKELHDNYGFKVEPHPNLGLKDLIAKLREINRRPFGPKDQVLFFFSGHGHYQAGSDNGYFIPSDGPKTWDYGEGWLSYATLRDYLGGNKARHILVGIDACHSGAFGPSLRGRPEALPWQKGADCDELQRASLKRQSRLFFSSGNKNERTPAQSQFFSQWLTCLRELPQQGRYLVTDADLERYISTIRVNDPQAGRFAGHEEGGGFAFIHKNACAPAPPPDRATDRAAWLAAEQAKTLPAYRKYLTDFPNGEFRPLAEQRILALEAAQQEERDWDAAKKTNTVKAYNDFIARYPNSDYRELAILYRDRITPPKAPDHLAFIKGGTFQMGCTAEQQDCGSDEKPVATVTVSDFYMGKYEVTFEEYDAFCEAAQREKPSDQGWGRGKRPVMNVTWYDVVEYCNWRSEREGLTKVYTIDKTKQDPNNQNSSDNQKWTVTANWKANGYRLPTEAEWEYAAREGGKKVLFGNGKNVANPKEINFDASASYKTAYSVAGEYRQKTVPVGSLNSPNALGLHDMSGNVWEWCWDWYGSDYYAKSNNSRDPRGTDKGSSRVARGGGWNSYPRGCRAAYRLYWSPALRDLDVGFRLARS